MKLTRICNRTFNCGYGCIFCGISKVTVFAAASMTDALQQIADQYQTEKPNNTVVFSLLLLLRLQNKLKKVHLQTYLFQLATNG